MRHTHCTVHAIGLNEDILFQKKKILLVYVQLFFFLKKLQIFIVFLHFFCVHFENYQTNTKQIAYFIIVHLLTCHLVLSRLFFWQQVLCF